MSTLTRDQRIVVCTGNPHKVAELETLLPDLRLEPLPEDTILPPEIGKTLLDNARIKAHAGTGLYEDAWLLADDSGLLVDALDGAPGVHSARFAGKHATDAENVEHLLKRLSALAPDISRAARFECVLVLVSPAGDEFVARGSVDGTITSAPRGEHGFGYDPVFVPDGETQTFAQLGDEAKAHMSHRARAANQLLEQLLTHA